MAVVAVGEETQHHQGGCCSVCVCVYTVWISVRAHAGIIFSHGIYALKKRKKTQPSSKLP